MMDWDNACGEAKSPALDGGGIKNLDRWWMAGISRYLPFTELE